MNKRVKNILYILLIFFFFSFIYYNNCKNINTYKDNLMIHYIDVNQGDSALIQYKNTNILVDGGTKENSKKLIKYLKENGVSSLDYIIATHPHDDHIGSLSEIVKNFKVKNFYGAKVTANTNSFKELVVMLKKKNLKIRPILAPFKLTLDDSVSLNFISPNKLKYDNLNNYSLVFSLNYNDFSFLFTGDAEKEAEEEMIKNNYNLKCNILKLGHHGSNTSTTKAFLEKCNPDIAIVSCALGNDYGHPNKDLINTLNKKNIKIYKTYKDGNIVFICNGKELKKYKK